jgi:hypothetical protein
MDGSQHDKMMQSSGLVEVDLFPEEVNSLEHPEVLHFRELLEEVALEYHCRLTFFDISCGIVSFSFDNDELTVEILKLLKNEGQD